MESVVVAHKDLTLFVHTRALQKFINTGGPNTGGSGRLRRVLAVRGQRHGTCHLPDETVMRVGAVMAWIAGAYIASTEGPGNVNVPTDTTRSG